MCVAEPLKVIKVEKNRAKVKLENQDVWINTKLISEPIQVGEYLIAYQNTATTKLAAKEAQKILELFGGE